MVLDVCVFVGRVRMCHQITDFEVERAKRYLKNNLLLQLDGTTAVCEDIGRFVPFSEPKGTSAGSYCFLNPQGTLAGSYCFLTPEDIGRFVLVSDPPYLRGT